MTVPVVAGGGRSISVLVFRLFGLGGWQEKDSFQMLGLDYFAVFTEAPWA
jgi:hypothetical protein